MGAYFAAHLQVREMNNRLQIHSWAKITHSQLGVIWGGCSTSSPAARKAGLCARQQYQSFLDRGEGTQGEPLNIPLGGHVLLWATNWPYRDTTRQAAGKFPHFLGSGWFTAFKVFSVLFCFRQVWFLVHCLFMCPGPGAVQEVIIPVGVQLLVNHIFSCYNNKCGIKALRRYTELRILFYPVLILRRAISQDTAIQTEHICLICHE